MYRVSKASKIEVLRRNERRKNAVAEQFNWKEEGSSAEQLAERVSRLHKNF